MRFGMNSLTMRSLALLCLMAPLTSGHAAQRAAEKPASSAVKVTVDQRAYAEGTPVKIILTNGLKKTIALPGCASYSLHQFVDDNFVPLPPRRCEWEGEAVMVPPGDRTFKFDPPHDQRVILRVAITYGIGCREGVALSLAQCERFDTAWSPTFVVLQAVEP